MQQNGHPPDLVNSIPSRALEVWRRLYTRYTLEPGPATVAPDVLKTIIPVTQADQLLARHRGIVEDTVIDAVASFVVHTVPQGIRRTLLTMRVHRLTGTWNLDLVEVVDVSESANVSITPQAATDNLFVTAWTAPLVLEQGDQVSVDIPTHSVNGNLRLEMWVVDEDLF